MKFAVIKWTFLCFLTLFAMAYVAGAVMLATDNETIPPPAGKLASYSTITLFGASGTAGDGILKAALSDPYIETIHVITRRTTPRIEAGVETGKVKMTLHMDYMDYTPVLDQVADSDAIFWAIGINSMGVDEQTYAMIHVDFPMRFVEAWTAVSTKPNTIFHYISSSDISEQSSSMWARQKVRAENALFDFADDHALKVVAYRPDFIGPTQEEAHIVQDLLFWFFRPVGAAVRARQIGQAMMEVTAREAEFENGDKLVNSRIIQYSDAYEKRQQSRQ